MAWDKSVQKCIKVPCGNTGILMEISRLAFSGTGLTLEVDSKMTRICEGSIVLPMAEPNGYETLYADRVLTSGQITIARKITPIILQAGADDPAEYITSNDWVNVPLGVCPVAATLKKVSWYNKTEASGGSPIIRIGDTRCAVTGKAYDHTGGNVEKEITGTAGDYDNLSVGDKVWLIGDNLTNGIYTVASVATDGSYITVTETVHSGDDTNVGVSTIQSYISDEEAKSTPADGVTLAISAVTDFADNAFPVVPAGATLIAGTSGGTTGDPAGLMVQLELEPVPTSGLAVTVLNMGH